MHERSTPPRRTALAVGIVVLITLVAAWQRIPGLQPPSLWLDDQWVAALAKLAPVSFLFTESYPCPPAFVLALKVVTSVLGIGEWQSQAIPFAAALGVIPVLGWATTRATGSRAIGVVAATLIAGNPLLAIYGLRVKPFATDALATAVLLALSVRFLRGRDPRSFAVLAITAALLPLFSFSAMIVGTAFVNVLGTTRPTPANSRARLITWTIGFDLAIFAIYALAIRGRGNDLIHGYWAAFYLPIATPSALPEFLWQHGLDLVTQAFPSELPWFALTVPIGLLAFLIDAKTRPLGVASLVVFGGLLGLSAFSLYPLGGGRTDVFSFPLTVFVAANSLSLLQRIPPRKRLAPLAAKATTVLAALLFSFFAICGPETSHHYPESGAAALMRRTDAVVQDGDGLLVYPWTNWAVGLYGRWPAWVEPVDDSTNGFYVRVDRAHTLVLRESHDGVRFDDRPHVVRQQLGPFLRVCPRRLFYVADRGMRKTHGWIVEAILAAGFRVEGEEFHDGAILMTFRR